jgi:hypothetical protein
MIGNAGTFGGDFGGTAAMMTGHDYLVLGMGYRLDSDQLPRRSLYDEACVPRDFADRGDLIDGHRRLSALARRRDEVVRP